MYSLLRSLLYTTSRIETRTVQNFVNPVLSKIIKYDIFKQVHTKTISCQEIVSNVEESQEKKAISIVSKVNEIVTNNLTGRLFAVVHICGKQFKITSGDIIIIEGYWPPDIGDEIRLDKILCVGGADFSLIGRPLVQQGLVTVKATVIEKALSHTKTHFRKRKRKQYQRINFYRIQHTMLRINSINITGEIDNPKEIEGIEERIF